MFSTCAGYSESQHHQGAFGLPVHIRSSLFHHGLFSVQYLFGVDDVEEVDRHEEGNGDVPPHGVGELILWVEDCILRKKELVK